MVPGDIEFANRCFEPTAFASPIVPGSEQPSWFKVIDQSFGERPSITLAGPSDVYQERLGVLAIIIESARLARFLAQLEVGRTGAAFIFDGNDELVAAPDKDADELHPARGAQKLLPLAQVALAKAGAENDAWRNRLPAGGWQLSFPRLSFSGRSRQRCGA